MSQITRSALGIVCLSGLLAACATEPPSSTPLSGHAGAYRVGVPYQIGGKWYYPSEQPDYDEVGIASWYGPSFYGKPTADGEIYDGDGLTAAHKTLPLPVNVQVTNLDNGKSLVLRVNDRGPFADGRIIDVSRHAAELLGFYEKGTARVRVTYLGRADVPTTAQPMDDLAREIASSMHAPSAVKVPTATVRTRTRTTAPAPIRVASLAPPPAERVSGPAVVPPVAAAVPADEPPRTMTAISVEPSSRLYVQAGAFSSRDNAERLKARLGEAGAVFISESERQGKPLYLVRSGPYDDLETANAALARLAGLGNNGAQIVVGQ